MTPQIPHTIDDYIARLPADVAAVITQIRQTVGAAAPEATETIAYQMPTFRLGRRNLVHFAAFKGHIGLYPPVRAPDLAARVAPYRGEKGALRFPIDQPIPHGLIADIVRAKIAAVQKTRG